MIYKCLRRLIRVMKELSKKLLEYLKKVPKGKVTTYKHLAIRFKTHPRAVGSILRSNPTLIEVPCHRVVHSNGDIGGYKRGIEKKIALLKKEGVEIKRKKVRLEKCKWKTVLEYEKKKKN